MQRPVNHVTREQAKRAQERGLPCPDLTEAQVAWLEVHFAPKCYEPTKENLEAHLKYAGKVELVAMLRAQLDERTGGDEHLDPTTMPADLARA